VPKAPGKYTARIPVTTDLNGLEVVVWVHALVGARPGPTLTLLAGLHGNEWLHLEFFRRFVEEFEPQEVSGTVLVIPMANAVAFGSLSRYVRDDSDNADANRSFPGKGRRFTWLAEQIATIIATEVFPSTDCMIDFHLGIWGSTMGSIIVDTDYSDPEVGRKSFDLSLAFGTPLILAIGGVQGWPGPRTSQTYAGELLGIPSCGSMVGGAGFDRAQEQAWLDQNLQGIRNAMMHLGMAQGEMVLPDEYLVYATVERVNPRAGGLLQPANPSDTFGRPVAEGELLGCIVSPFTFETLEELTAPFDGYLAYWARSYPIRPGEWAFAVIPRNHEGTRWIPRPEW
jgi:predicted deacylase